MATDINWEKEEIVRNITTLWGNMTDQQYATLLAHLSIQTYKKDEFIYKDLECPRHALYLVHGKVKIFKDGIGGRNQIIRVMKPTDFFGYRAYFAHEDYKTAAMAIEFCAVASFPIDILLQLMSQNFNISRFFIATLSKELGASDDRTVNLTQKHIRGRLAEALIFLKDSYGLEEDGYTLSIYLSREDLANLSNMTTSNAIRTLSAFANEKLVAIDGRKIKIIKEEDLRHISELG